MAKLDDDTEKHIDESMPFIFENLGDASALRNDGCFTLAQCAFLYPALILNKNGRDVSEARLHYFKLVMLDAWRGDLKAKHPKTHIQQSEYRRLAKAGLFGIDGGEMPFVTAGWLVPLNEVERWLQSKDIHIDLEDIKAEVLEWKRTAELGTVLQPQDAPKGITKEQVLIAFEEMVKPFKLAGALKNGKGLFGNDEARTQRGTPGATHAALWNPVILAVGLNEKYSVPMLHLKNAFKDHQFLRGWSDEWNNALDLLSE